MRGGWGLGPASAGPLRGRVPALPLSVAQREWTMVATTELSGPDLERGVSAEALPDGGTLLGHAEGEAVLLVRRGQELVALGASGTHYGGPLAEGTVVGNSIR